MNKKGLTYALLATITLMPWSATAISRYSVNMLQKSKIDDALIDIPTLSTTPAESLLVKGLLEISQGKNQQALNTIDQLLRIAPNFKLAHLVRGDLLMAQGKYLQSFGGVNTPVPPEAVKDLQEEARSRIEHYLSSKSLGEKHPDILLSPNDEQNHVIVIDTDKSRLYLYKNNHGNLSYVTDYYVTVGKNGIDKQSEGDKRTPIGVYFAGKKLAQQLPDLYGDAAYPLNYPNEWDAHHNKKGSGIWVHGTPSNTYSRPPRASDGCVVLTAPDLKALGPILQSGKTPVIIANNLKWLDASNELREKQALSEAINNWVEDWRSQDTPQYLSHYSRDFFATGFNYQQWSAHKTRVQASKPKVDIEISDISMFSYPDAENKIVVVDFVQDFKSPYLKNKMQKRQYWIQESNTWKIIYEGAA